MVKLRPGRILIWSETDLYALTAVQPKQEGAALVMLTDDAVTTTSNTAPTGFKGKYSPFAAWLMNQSRDVIEMTFEKVEEVIGFPLPRSAREHDTYWRGRHRGSTIGTAIKDAGWRVKHLHMPTEHVTLERDRKK
jgi:hypothetical protein